MTEKPEQNDLAQQYDLILPKDNSILKLITSLFVDKKKGSEESIVKALVDDLRFLRKTYGLTIEMEKRGPRDPNTIINVDKLSIQEAFDAVEIVRQEIIKYPPSYIKNLNIERFRLTKGLTRLNTKSDGIEEHQRVGGLAYRNEKYLYVTYQEISHLRETFHHELYHRRDHEDEMVSVRDRITGFFKGGLEYERFRKQWKKLNPHAYAGDKYIELAKGQHYAIIKGFARYYGVADHYEDRATVAELLMTNIKNLIARAQTDEVLAAKVNMLVKKFGKQTDNQMDLQYFRDLMHGKIGEDYWVKKNAAKS